MLGRVVSALVSVARVAMFAAFVVMVALTLIQVLNRYALGFTIFWTEELIVLLLVWSMLLGLPVQLWDREEILVDVIPLANERLQNAKLVLATICSIVFCAVLAVTGYQFAARGMPVSSPALSLSRFWFFVPIPLSAALSVLVLVARPRGPAHEAFEA
ncbi:TRAP transporter small permease [Microvirga massiliensis]|uniref:TRAP transporter small permease n=1 Tax=Microvirga massiliensis TaxID=1033741 RepID=UPI00062B4BBC|nr:TRAP transporter small permease subunit [Microvirga massiliensis]